MAKHSFSSFFETLSGAIGASQALEAGRRPTKRDLHKLGIDPKAFEKVQLR